MVSKVTTETTQTLVILVTAAFVVMLLIGVIINVRGPSFEGVPSPLCVRRLMGRWLGRQ